MKIRIPIIILKTLVLLFLSIPSHFVWAEAAVRFQPLTIEDGLSQSAVLAVYQDSQGFMWFGTYDGLNRYDGYHFKQFRYESSDDSSISNNAITAIFEDSRQRLWIGTEGGGVNLYVRDRQRFVRYQNSENPNSLSHDVVTAIGEDNQGQIWIGTVNGLNLLANDSDSFVRILHNKDNNHSLSNNHITSIYRDRQDTMWIGTDGGGLNRFDNISGQFFHYNNHSVDESSISHNRVSAILQDLRGNLWVSTLGGGINRFDADGQNFIRYRQQQAGMPSVCDDWVLKMNVDLEGNLWTGSDNGLCKLNTEGKRLNRFTYDPSDPSGLNNNSIRSIYFDRKGFLWVGTFGGGVSKIDHRQKQFGHYKHATKQPKSLSNNVVFSVLADTDGDMWIGTSDGLNRQLGKSGEYEVYRTDPENENSLADSFVWTLYQDKQKRIWIGSNAGVTVYDASNDKFTRNGDIHPNLAALSNDAVVSVLTDSNGYMWFGTWGGGLVRFNQKTGDIKRFNNQSNDPLSIANDVVLKVFEDSKGNIWFGTNDGLNRYNGNDGFIQFIHNKDEPNSLSQGYVMTIFEDDRGTLWVGTSGGLNKLNAKQNGFLHYEERHGLANRVINCITQDKSGWLWVSTNMGLSRLDLDTLRFKNYNVSAGLQSSEFNVNACATSGDGELYFGGINGINRFYPERLLEDVEPPQVKFTEMFLFNQEVAIGYDKTPSNQEFKLPRAIDRLTELNLSYKQSLVTFEFAALDYRAPADNRYQYMLYGYDEEWIDSDADIRRATYTNLPSGDYTLWVRAANADGYWNEDGSTINIHVKPPPWLSWWAYLLYAFAFSLLVFGFINYRIHHNRMMHEMAVNKRLKELDKLKDTFLTNTSHELRTPLNGIIGLSESLIDGVAGRLPERAMKNLAMVVASGKRLANLVNDILDMSKLKHKGIELHTQAIDIHSVVGVVLALSEPLVNDKPVKLINNIPVNLPPVEADEDRLLQIIHNLLGNAIKFTEEGSISVSAVVTGAMVAVKVRDSGIGIPEEQFESIFEMFEQVEDADNTRNYGGSGLGLAITKQLIQLHGGTIDVESKMAEGTVFTFTIPISNKSMVGKRQAIQPIDSHSMAEPVISVEQPGWQIPLSNEVPPLPSDEQEAMEHEGSRFKVLLVDDEPVNLQVIHNHLSLHNYQMVEASSGAQALYLLNSEGPFDLVLLDVMMPKLSGFEVCKQIRQTYSAVQLPVIFLTAKSQVEDMVYGFEIGANDYINKPVSKHELLHRVDFHLRMHEVSCNLERVVEERTAQIVEAQKKLVLSDKLATLGTLMAGIAHEINNPTSFVNVCLYELEGDLATCRKYIYDLAGPDAAPEILEGFSKHFEPLFKHMETMKEGLDRIKTIVKDLKTSSHMNDEEKSIVCITDIILSTVNLVSAKHKQNVTITTNFVATPFIKCYPARLSQVFMNLLVNACDALSGKTEGVIEVGCRLAGKKVEITIWDNGSGMTKETREKLFEPFYTTKGIDKGTGLGLSISYDIVQKHGGEITVESEVGKGSCFKILLPV